MGEKRAAPEKLDAWKALRAHQKKFGPVHMRDLFKKDKDREKHFSADACGLRVDFSRHLATRKTLKLLAKLAKEAGGNPYFLAELARHLQTTAASSCGIDAITYTI